MASSLTRKDLVPQFVEALQCPVCTAGLSSEGARLTCTSGHSFDRARQGFVTLRGGYPMPQNADTAAMVEARDELLGSGLYQPIRERVAHTVQSETVRYQAAQRETRAISGSTPIPMLADLAGGTGYYLAGILDANPEALGLCLDIAPAALKRAARSHERSLAIGADLLRNIPIADAALTVATSIFGPRNVTEIERVLVPGGALVVVTPTSRHLQEVIEPLGMVSVHESKDARLDASLSGFTKAEADLVEFTTHITRDQARAIAAMGPSAHHTSASDLDARVRELPETLFVTVSVKVSVYRK